MAGLSLFDLRNRLLSSPGFRSAAQKIPFFQWVARKRARQLFHLASGFIHSQVLLTCVRLELFEKLADGAQTVTQIAADAGMPESRARHLLRAAAALRLLESRPGDEFGLGVLGAAMTANEALQALVGHHALLYRDLDDPLALFTDASHETTLSGLWPYAGSHEAGELHADDVTDYTALMAASQAMIAEQVLDAFSLRRYASLMDIGGGAGAFASAAAMRWPNLDVTVADLPAVATIARDRIAASGLSERIDVIGIDATRDTLPSGFDVVTLVRILHDHDDAAALDILSAARRALGPGGVLLVAEPMTDAPGAGDLIDAYFNVYLLAMGSGRPRNFREIEALMREAGFTWIRRRRTSVPLVTGLLVAKP